jgi:hypothetical protein
VQMMALYSSSTLSFAVPWLPYPVDNRSAHLEYLKDECTKKGKMVRKIIHLCRIWLKLAELKHLL